jgi:hypothetical protein
MGLVDEELKKEKEGLNYKTFSSTSIPITALANVLTNILIGLLAH